MMVKLRLFLLCYCIVLTFFCNADPLVFAPGTTVRSVISQKNDTETSFALLPANFHTDSSFTFDITLLDLDPNTLSYPIEVEVTTRHIFFKNVLSSYGLSTDTTYNSEATPDNAMEKILARLINFPLHFKITSPSQIDETTGKMKEIGDALEREYHFDLFESIRWNIDFLILQSFHLAGEEISVDEVLPLTCKHLLNWNGYILNGAKITKDTGQCLILEKTPATVQGLWKGEASFKKSNLTGNAKVNGTIQWDTINSLIQHRTINVTAKTKKEEFFFNEENSLKLNIELNSFEIPEITL